MESLGLVFRALVMLACLAVVPLVAMYGKYVPDFAQSVMEAFKARSHAKGADDPNVAGGEAPPFAGSTARSSGGRSAPASGTPRAGAPAPWNDRSQPAKPLSDWGQQASADAAAQNAPLERASFNAPVANASTPDAARPAPDKSDTGPGDPEASAGDSCTAQFRRIEKRLRELGATYYLLETWGSNGDRYRFFCKMALAGNADYNRNRIFQATAADPLRAMQDVLTQVEQWRSGGTP